uniref:Uncharacterized protein n=1 Tax=Siphoviridae sp. ctDtx1 TaxID=2825391 RepID=A0A8S5PSX8_9CAUD|nr:MAG TPA: hypothetical protein [Siphoviridae sp. ctDtx1]
MRGNYMLYIIYIRCNCMPKMKPFYYRRRC